MIAGTTLEPVAVAREYRDLVAALRRERVRLGLTCEALDHITNLPDRYTNKLENWRSPSGRTLGALSLPLMLGALDMAIMIVRLPRKQDIPCLEEQQFRMTEDGLELVSAGT